VSETSMNASRRACVPQPVSGPCAKRTPDSGSRPRMSRRAVGLVRDRVTWRGCGPQECDRLELRGCQRLDTIIVQHDDLRARSAHRARTRRRQPSGGSRGPIPRAGVSARSSPVPSSLDREVIEQDRKGHAAWTRFAFPTWWHYDVLRGLEYLRRAGVAPAERMAGAIDLVATKRDRDGRWLLETRHAGHMPVELEEVENQPSRWNTLRALRVLRWSEKAAHASHSSTSCS
jgi:hypothetical protein